jgi:hypothetical protein
LFFQIITSHTKQQTNKTKQNKNNSTSFLSFSPQGEKENAQPEKARNVVHPSLLKKEVARVNEGGVEIRPADDATPKKKGVKFSADTPKACRQVSLLFSR